MAKVKKDNRTNNDPQNTTQKTKDRVTGTSLRTEDQPKADIRLILVLHLFGLQK